MKDLGKTLPVTDSLAKALEAQGFELPPKTREIRIEVRIDSTFVIVYTCSITANDLVAIGKALAQVGNEALAEDAKANWPL